jgi:hypothetical protein
MFALAVMLVFAISGQAMATLADGDLIRVVYKTNGTGVEVFTDLTQGNTWTSAAAVTGTTNYSANNFALSQFAGSGWGDLSVAYYVYNGAAGGYNFWMSGNATTQSNAAGKAGTVKAGLAAMKTAYNGVATGTLKQGSLAQASASSYWNKMNLNAVATAGSMAAMLDPGTAAKSLADLATTGYVDQYLFYYPTATSNSAGNGVAVATIRTYADGTTSVMAAPEPSAVPVPAALYLFGSGLLGLVGIRRKMAA